MDKNKDGLPVPENWQQTLEIISGLVAENRQYRDGWASEVIQQAKRNAKAWFMAWLITLAALIGTNAAWIYVFQSYDYISQDGTGINSYKTEIRGDVINGTEDP